MSIDLSKSDIVSARPIIDYKIIDSIQDAYLTVHIYEIGLRSEVYRF